jgi:hypothetical protein
VFNLSGLSEVLKKAPKHQQEFLKIYREILKKEWNNKK